MTESSAEKPRPRGEETRERILAAAYAQFIQNGYHGTSMRQIAQAAGLAVGGIYNHFAGKEEVFAAVLDQHHPYHAMLPALAQAQGETLEAFIRQAARLIETAVADRRDAIMPLLFIELLEFQGRHLKDLAERLMPTMGGFVQGIAERSGEMRPLPLPVVQRAFMSLLIGYFFTGFVLRESPLFPESERDWLAGVVDVFLRGILDD
jgi:AcrR family transcriptional regulator